MENAHEVYEVPTATEAGDYADLTRGDYEGYVLDGGIPPFFLYYA